MGNILTQEIGIQHTAVDAKPDSITMKSNMKFHYQQNTSNVK